jgi:peptidoglycan/xylan/chitin deacetylase (PgdA/CDA1 family)
MGAVLRAGGLSAGLSITVDVDGAAGLPGGGAGYEPRLSRWSERTYGITRGLERILTVLDEFAAAATFYVPGVTAERHRDEVSELAATRHEVAHHGYSHRRPDQLDEIAQRDDVVAGCRALESVTGRVPEGYRAPGWELTERTLTVLGDCGFVFDSSLMGDDRPYVVDTGGGRAIVEMPVDWALDDAPHFAHTTDPRGLLATWRAELDDAWREGRHTTVTCHPEILGRAHRVDVLRRLLDAAASRRVPCCRHGDVARALLATGL